MKCKKCGTEFSEGVFCPECGTKNEEVSENEQYTIQQDSVEIPNTDINNNLTKINDAEMSQHDDKTANVKEGGRIIAILSLICGIVSILSCGAFIIPEVLGIVFGVMGKNNIKMRGIANVGMVLSIISIGVLVLVFIIGMLFS